MKIRKLQQKAVWWVEFIVELSSVKPGWLRRATDA